MQGWFLTEDRDRLLSPHEVGLLGSHWPLPHHPTAQRSQPNWPLEGLLQSHQCCPLSCSAVSPTHRTPNVPRRDELTDMIAWAFFYKKLEDLDSDEAGWSNLWLGFCNSTVAAVLIGRLDRVHAPWLHHLQSLASS